MTVIASWLNWLVATALNWLAATVLDSLKQRVLRLRRDKSEWLVAARHVAHDLARGATDLKHVLDCGFVPLVTDEGFLSKPGWDAYSAVFARLIPNTDEGEAFWAGISALFDSLTKTRALLVARQPGSPIELAFAEAVLRPGITALTEAYGCFSDNPPPGLEAAIA
jgi:hypothetical protein